MVLVHHDDARREFAYGAESQIGTFSDALMVEAKKNGWTVISMKDEWKKIFALSNSQDSTPPPHPDKTTSKMKPAGIQTLLQKFMQSG